MTYMAIVKCIGNDFCREFNQNLQPVRNKTNRENTCQRKQSHAQDNIYVIRQFAYVHGVAGISLLSGKNTIMHKNTLKKPNFQLHPSTLLQKK